MNQTTVINRRVLSDYPSIDNVHFPFQRPYKVQRALMETLLEALRPDCRDITRIGASGKSFLSSGGSPRRKAKVVFLESPTGTGKSFKLG